MTQTSKTGERLLLAPKRGGVPTSRTGCIPYPSVQHEDVLRWYDRGRSRNRTDCRRKYQSRILILHSERCRVHCAQGDAAFRPRDTPEEGNGKHGKKNRNNEYTSNFIVLLASIGRPWKVVDCTNVFFLILLYPCHFPMHDCYGTLGAFNATTLLRERVLSQWPVVQTRWRPMSTLSPKNQGDLR